MRFMGRRRRLHGAAAARDDDADPVEVDVVHIVDGATLRPRRPLDDRWFADAGRVVARPAEVLDALGVDPAGVPAASLPVLVRRGVHEAEHGVIQDPAGSAVGAPRLRGGGASGAIYGAFADLRPIPAMAPGAAVGNASTGPGRRVLHSHSPSLQGDPRDERARAAVLVALGEAYANAVVAFAERAPELGDDGHELHLVPLSSSIYAGAFARDEFASPHLDPSYTLVAVVAGFAWASTHGVEVPATTLAYFSADVFAVAQDRRRALAAALGR